MSIEDEINRKNLLRIRKKYGNSIISQVKKEFEHIRFWWGETIKPPSRIHGKPPKLYKGEECRNLRYCSDCHTDICGYTVQSLRPNGVFKNFLGKTCKNRKEIGIYPYMAMHFDKFAKA